MQRDLYGGHQRVRDYFTNCYLRFGLRAPARMATYSPRYFLQTFRSAYQETPHASLVDMWLNVGGACCKNAILQLRKLQASDYENR